MNTGGAARLNGSVSLDLTTDDPYIYGVNIPSGFVESGPMSAAEVREAWIEARDEAIARAMANKQSQDALSGMAQLYRSLSADDRPVVDQLLSDELNSDDATVRFDALSLIADFTIRTALPALRELSDWLESQRTPGAPYERAKVSRLIALLDEAADPQ
jgi:hypothetical protein